MLESTKKEIKEFPKPFKFTPYSKLDFSENINKVVPLNSNLSVCKVIILGDLCVGKTSLLNRFCYKIFESDYKSTIGVDFQTEQIEILGIPYHLQIWDTAGQERFKCIAQCYYRKAHVIILVFDLSSIRTLANCKKWLHDALQASNENEPRYIFLVGSKKDLLVSEAAYKSVEIIAEKTSKLLKAEFWSVSSKTGENIDDLFCRAAALSFDDHFKVISESYRNSVQIGTDLISFKQSTQERRKNRNKCNNFGCVNESLLKK